MSNLEMKDVRVLVVDDDPVVLRLMAGYMGHLGCQAIFCKNGKEAVGQVRAMAFDICFMDIFMPEMNGVEATVIIREEVSKILPIIAITASPMKTNRDTCIEVGMNDFVIKPVSQEIVADMIRRYALS